MRSLALVLAGLVMVATPARASGVFNPEIDHLANGMEVVVIPNHRAPVVSHMVWYKVGGADEPWGKSGMAHFLEHLLFKGTPKHPEGDFSAIVSRNGGELNAFTAHDFTAFYETVARDRLETMMALESDRMMHLVLTDAQVAPEKKVVLEELHMRVDNDPSAILDQQMDAALYLNYPYQRPVIGWEQEVRALTTSDVLTFYREWYAPNNAILVVAGDVTMKDVKPLAEKYYGKIPAGTVGTHLKLEEPAQPAERRVILHDERVRQRQWLRTYLAPSFLAPTIGPEKTATPYVLQVLAELLGGGTTSRLYRQLVVDQGIAVGASAWYDPVRRGPGQFSISVTPKGSIDLKNVEDAVDKVLAGLEENPPDTAEIERAKLQLTSSFVYGRDSLSTGAYVLGQALAVGMKVDDVEAWPERIEAVNAADVASAAASVLDRRHSVTGELLDTSTDAAEKP